VPAEISTSYAERGNLSIRMACRRFMRLTNAFSKKLENHIAAVALYVAFYNFCRPHETLTPNAKHQTTPAMALSLTDHVWSFGELIDAALGAVPPTHIDIQTVIRKQNPIRKNRGVIHWPHWASTANGCRTNISRAASSRIICKGKSSAASYLHLLQRLQLKH
jgi:hypothetical protein